MRKLFIFSCLIAVCLLSSCTKTNEVKKFISKDDQIGILTFWTSNGSYTKNIFLMNLGHSFFSFTNTSDSSIFIGNYEVKTKEEITFGSWLSTIHNGLWYNLESMLIIEYDRYSDRVGISMSMSETDIEKLNNYLSENDISWYPWCNCSVFCCNVWNILNTDQKLNITTPAAALKIFKNYEQEKEIEITPNDKMGYFDDDEFIEITFA